MMLEKMKMNAELLRVQAAKAEMELKIFERTEEIKRLEANIEIQNEKIKELENGLARIKGE